MSVINVRTDRINVSYEVYKAAVWSETLSYYTRLVWKQQILVLVLVLTPLLNRHWIRSIWRITGRCLITSALCQSWSKEPGPDSWWIICQQNTLCQLSSGQHIDGIIQLKQPYWKRHQTSYLQSAIRQLGWLYWCSWNWTFLNFKLIFWTPQLLF